MGQLYGAAFYGGVNHVGRKVARMSVGAIQGSQGVEGAIRHASRATGVDFDFLIKTAQRESAMNPDARARTSSAAGLFQFIEQTWLATLKRHGAQHGYSRYADLITQGADGRYRVAGQAARGAVLDLRFDPRAASLMAAELAAGNAAYLRGRTGREPSAGDLYAAHFLGPAGSARLMEAVQSRPGSSAVALFPDAARANRSIFYRQGRPATVSEVYANLQRTAGGGPAAPAEPSPPRIPALPPMSPQDVAMAARMDRLNRDQNLLGLLLNGETSAGAGFATQFLAAFGPDDKS